MKKVAAALMLMLLIYPLAGCGGDKKTNAGPVSAATAAIAVATATPALNSATPGESALPDTAITPSPAPTATSLIDKTDSNKAIDDLNQALSDLDDALKQSQDAQSEIDGMNTDTGSN